MKKPEFILACVAALMIFACKTEISNQQDKNSLGPSEIFIERAVSNFNERELKDALRLIRHWHQKSESRLLEGLQPSLGRQETVARLEKINCKPPEEYLILYEWHNGSSDRGPLLWYHNFMPIERALAERERMLELLGPSWKPTWLPVFEFEGEYYFIDCLPDSGAALPVYYFFLEEPEITYAYVNLTSMMKTAKELMESNVVALHSDFSFDDKGIDKIYEVYRRHNKETNFPYAIR